MNPVLLHSAQSGPGAPRNGEGHGAPDHQPELPHPGADRAAGAPVPPPGPDGEPTLDPRLVTTAFEFPGYRITRNLGMVRGVVVRSRSIVGSIFAGIQTLFGGNITVYTELCEKVRADAFGLMVEQAEEVGANAIIGARYDANEVTSGVTEVLAYGTAVIAEKVQKGTPLDN
jgi:uncharacterized protein YbjQ (UPF0145 family)